AAVSRKQLSGLGSHGPRLLNDFLTIGKPRQSESGQQQGSERARQPALAYRPFPLSLVSGGNAGFKKVTQEGCSTVRCGQPFFCLRQPRPLQPRSRVAFESVP